MSPKNDTQKARVASHRQTPLREKFCVLVILDVFLKDAFAEDQPHSLRDVKREQLCSPRLPSLCPTASGRCGCHGRNESTPFHLHHCLVQEREWTVRLTGEFNKGELSTASHSSVQQPYSLLIHQGERQRYTFSLCAGSERLQRSSLVATHLRLIINLSDCFIKTAAARAGPGSTKNF